MSFTYNFTITSLHFKELIQQLTDYGPDLLPGKIKKNKAQARDHVS